MSLGLSGIFLDPVGTHPVCQPGYWALGAKLTFFSWGGGVPKCGVAKNCLKIHPIAVFFILTELALLHPLGFQK